MISFYSSSQQYFTTSNTIFTFLQQNNDNHNTQYLTDHLPPEIREALDELDDTEQTQIPKLIRKIDKIQIIIETAKLNTVDHDSQPITFTQTKDIIQNLPPVSLSKIKKDVGMVSHDLDCIAADIDSVRSLGNDEVKQQKKRLSSSVVTLMKRIDEYMDLCT